jgi:hypothetical protein
MRRNRMVIALCLGMLCLVLCEVFGLTSYNKINYMLIVAALYLYYLEKG